MLTCSQVVHQENLSLRSTLRMTGPLLEELWTGTSRTLLLILCSARLAFVDANGGAILPSLNKVLIDIGTPDKLAVRQNCADSYDRRDREHRDDTEDTRDSGPFMD